MPDLRTTLAALGLTQTGASRLLGVDPRTMRRWVAGSREMPEPAMRLLRVLDIAAVRERLLPIAEQQGDEHHDHD